MAKDLSNDYIQVFGELRQVFGELRQATRITVMGLSSQEARDLVDQIDTPEDLGTAFDQAQGDVRMGSGPQFIILRISD